jgi:hypothetical protein
VSGEVGGECICTLSYALLYQYTSRSTAKTRLIDASFYFSYFICFASTTTSPLPVLVGYMSTYAQTHIEASIHIDSKIYETEDWSDTPSLSNTTNTSSPSDNLFDLPPLSHEYGKMEDSWHNTPLPDSPCTDLGSIAPHGLSGHRRGPSELESTMWDTAQVNGELGLAPIMSSDAKLAAGLATSDLKNSIGREGIAPLPIAVWAKIMDTSKGRDKVLASSSGGSSWK